MSRSILSRAMSQLGKRTSPRKAAAARENGKRGGRPRGKYHVEQTTPAGWWKVVNTSTGACRDSVKGHRAALALCQKLNQSE